MIQQVRFSFSNIPQLIVFFCLFCFLKALKGGKKRKNGTRVHEGYESCGQTLANPEKAGSVSLLMFTFDSHGVFLLTGACCEHYKTLCTVENFRTKC